MVLKVVVLLKLFELTERGTDQGWVDDANVCRGFGIRTQRTGSRIGLGLIVLIFDRVQAVSLAGCLDVAIDVNRLKGSLIWANLEGLDDPRVKTTKDDGADHHETGSHD